MRKVSAIVLKSFLQGILIISPIAVTIYVIYSVFYTIDTIIPSMPPGIGFLLIIGVITAVGYLGTRFFLGRLIFDAFDYLLQNTPGIKFIYSSIKDIMDSFMGDKKRFNVPVWVQVNNNPEVWRIGFKTQHDMGYQDMEGMVAVYLPHSYAVSGWVIVVKEENTKPVTHMNASAAMKFAVSGGVTSSEDDEHYAAEQQHHQL